MDIKLFEAFSEHQDRAREIVLDLDSCGGHSRDMEEVVKILDLIKWTHRVNTRVGPGNTCGSACVFVFLSGKRRHGALTSSWLFHEAWSVVAGAGESIEIRSSSAWTAQALDKYFLPAGVSKKWLARLRHSLHFAVWSPSFAPPKLPIFPQGTIAHSLQNTPWVKSATS